MAYCEGTGIETFKVRETAVFTVFTEGKGSVVEVSITGPAEVTPEIFDAGDGIFDVEWVPSVEGTYIISVSSNGVPVQGSPFKVSSERKFFTVLTLLLSSNIISSFCSTFKFISVKFITFFYRPTQRRQFRRDFTVDSIRRFYGIST
eukprot:TRINITY_DN1192_c0_g3_i1.p1 TRINITY_DN1192_c0_g3~~TRINITY_DN1192_c0_g3_i1.p1  ORF type:complete len:147 (+),score=14.45 TRINITY_DN1192_c0_g3_i1:19-459(+)